MSNIIIGFSISIALIIGGLSGQFVLRGTNSSILLVVVGSCLFIWDIYKLVTHIETKRRLRSRLKQAQLKAKVKNNENKPLKKEALVRFIREASVDGCFDNYTVYLNGAEAGKLNNDCKLEYKTSVPLNIITFDFNAEDITLELAAGDTAEIYIKAGKILNEKQNITHDEESQVKKNQQSRPEEVVKPLSTNKGIIGENNEKYCHSCGTLISVDTKFCPKCGTIQIQNINNKKKGLSIASFVIGIVSIMIPFIGFIGGIISLVFGIKEVRRSKNGFAIAGIVLGSLAILWNFILIIIGIASQ